MAQAAASHSRPHSDPQIRRPLDPGTCRSHRSLADCVTALLRFQNFAAFVGRHIPGLCAHFRFVRRRRLRALWARKFCVRALRAEIRKDCDVFRSPRGFHQRPLRWSSAWAPAQGHGMPGTKTSVWYRQAQDASVNADAICVVCWPKSRETCIACSSTENTCTDCPSRA